MEQGLVRLCVKNSLAPVQILPGTTKLQSHGKNDQSQIPTSPVSPISSSKKFLYSPRHVTLTSSHNTSPSIAASASKLQKKIKNRTVKLRSNNNDEASDGKSGLLITTGDEFSALKLNKDPTTVTSKSGQRILDNNLYVEKWLNNMLQKAKDKIIEVEQPVYDPVLQREKSFNPTATSITTPYLAKVGLDKDTLHSCHRLSHDLIDRLYRALYVYTIGFYEVINDLSKHTATCPQVIGNVLRSYGHLLEQCDSKQLYMAGVTQILNDDDKKLKSVEQSHEKKLSDIQKERSNLLSALDIVRAELTALKEENTGIIQNKEMLEDQIKFLTANISDLRDEREEHKKIIFNKDIKFNQLSKSIGDQDKLKSAHKSEIRSRDDEIKSLTIELDKSRNENSELKRQINEFQSKVKSLNSSLARSQNQLEDRSKECHDLTRKFSEIQGAYNTVTMDCETISLSKGKLQRDLDAATSQLTTSLTEIQRLNDLLRVEQDKTRAQDEVIARFDDTTADLRAAAAQQTGRAAELAANIEALQAEIQRAKKTEQALKASLGESKEMLSQQREYHAKTKAQLSRKEKLYQDELQGNEQLQRQLQANKKVKAQLVSDLNSVNSKLKEKYDHIKTQDQLITKLKIDYKDLLAAKVRIEDKALDDRGKLNRIVKDLNERIESLEGSHADMKGKLKASEEKAFASTTKYSQMNTQLSKEIEVNKSLNERVEQLTLKLNENLEQNRNLYYLYCETFSQVSSLVVLHAKDIDIEFAKEQIQEFESFDASFFGVDTHNLLQQLSEEEEPLDEEDSDGDEGHEAEAEAGDSAEATQPDVHAEENVRDFHAMFDENSLTQAAETMLSVIGLVSKNIEFISDYFQDKATECADLNNEKEMLLRKHEHKVAEVDKMLNGELQAARQSHQQYAAVMENNLGMHYEEISTLNYELRRVEKQYSEKLIECAALRAQNAAVITSRSSSKRNSFGTKREARSLFRKGGHAVSAANQLVSNIKKKK